MAVVGAFVDAWNAGDMDAVRELHGPRCDPEPAKVWPEPGPYMGREAAMGHYERVREAFDADTVELTGGFSRRRQSGCLQVDLARLGAWTRVDMELTTIFTVRNGKVREAEYFWDHNEALEAAGLSE